jgi:hypothetical protein
VKEILSVMALCRWLVTTFDSEERDPRDYITTEYGGLTLHIKPGHRDAASVIVTFLDHSVVHENAISKSLDGRSVFDDRMKKSPVPTKKQRSLF